MIYYDVSGIGKTSLRKELPKSIIKYNKSHKSSQIIWTTVDFETEEFRQPHKFLEILIDQLKVLVLFIDDDQVVRPDEIESVEFIKAL